MAKKETVEPITRELTLKQQKFVDCFDGNIKEAAEKSGLSYRYCRGLVAKKHILEAIRNRQDTEIRPKTISTRQERQSFWTEIMRNKAAMMRDRLKSSELLGKSEADFTENINNEDSHYKELWSYLSPAERMRVLERKMNGEKRWEELTPAERQAALERSLDAK
ncbi:MAG: hypothetical protein ABSG22_01275 [Sedimentisphaerales bacterium]|jgi:hypothetical protein